MGSLSDLPNIGKAIEKKLIDAGISTPQDLRDIGEKEAFLRIRAKDPSV